MGKYTDEFRAEAVVLLKAAGYPDKKGALQQVANNLGVHAMTISRWYKSDSNPPPNKIVNEKKQEIVSGLESLALKLVSAMGGKIEDATLQQSATTMGIVIDKWQLLQGEATERTEINGRITTIDYGLDDKDAD